MTKDCVDTAIEKYLERKDRDSNPTIVQMLNPRTRERIPHWYYRSDQFIFQPNDYWIFDVTAFVGNPSEAPTEVYGNGTFEHYPKIIRVAERLSMLSGKN